MPRTDEAAVLRMVEDSLDLKRRFFADNAKHLVAVAARLTEVLRGGGKILTFGNGGSAADAQHFACELSGRFLFDRRALPVLALTTDPSVVTAVGNDLGFEALFARQVEAHGRPGDAVLGITTSGKSPNVLRALQKARELGLVTVGLTGRGGGDVRALADHLIDVPHPDTPRIQEVHTMVVHFLCQMIEEAFVA